jgi:radical SAM protein with 4Fe4S-binding SPASM domain
MYKRYRRAINLFMSGASYVKSSMTRHPAVSAMPPAISIELTNHCNLHCSECTTGSGLMTRPKGFMDTGLYKRMIRELEPYLYWISLYFQGEPLMHPEFPLFISGSGRARTIMSTNGHFLTPDNCERILKSGLDKLIISLDGIDQDSYSKYRAGGNLETVIGGIKTISDLKKNKKSSIDLEVQTLVNRYNENDVPELKKFCRSVGIPLRLKSMQIISDNSSMSWLPDDPEYRRYDIKDGVKVIRSTFPDRCARLWFNPVITWDGNVLPCCFDKDADHIMGNINQEKFSEIWNGSRYMLFRRVLLTDRKTIGICRNCSSGLKGMKF